MTIVLLGAAVVGYRHLSAESCESRTELAVAAAPDLAPAVRSTAAQWQRDHPGTGGVCVTINVTVSEAADVAAAVATKHGVTLTGLGEANGTTEIPDVWLPDSSVWLVRLAAVAPGFKPVDGGSVAASPVVLAVPEPVATGLGWKDAAVTWTAVLDRLTKGSEVRSGMVDPTRDAASLSGLLSLSAAAATKPDAQSVTTAVLRSVAARGSAVADDLLARFPQSDDPVALANALSAAALSEVDVIRYNHAKPAVPLTALHVQPAPAALNYPFAVMPGTDPAKSTAAEGLREALNSAAFRAALTGLGLHPPDQAAGAAPTTPGAPSPPAGVRPGGPRGGPLDLKAVDGLLATWTVVTGPARMLAVIDVSGSMLRPVPTAGNATRIQLTVQTARQGLGLLDDTWSLGLWIFAARLDGDRDHRELVPIGLLSTRRPQLLAALGRIRAASGSNTGLNDTVLSAYQAVQDGWRPGQANSVVLFTDGLGNNDPDGGLSEAALLDRLQRIADPRRPVQMVLIGIGNEVNQKQLERIAVASGNGSAFVAQDPAQIGEIFLKAVARRPISPR